MHAAAVLLPFLSLVVASPIAYKRHASLDSCLSAASLNPITTSSSSYTSDTAAFNQRLQPTPTAIIYPSTPSQIATAVLCAASSSSSVSARGGGHSYASYGLAGDLVIDLGAFNEISVDENGLATVGAGNKLGDIALALNEQGRALPHGVCPFVGIGGHASFGGFGYAGRMWGLTLDTIAAYDVVLANGTVLTKLTAADDADLFWALDGAAPSFGIITTYYFNTFPAPSTAINYKYSYPSSHLSPSQAASLFSSYQSFGANSAPSELGFTLTVKDKQLAIDVSGVYYGSMNDFNGLMSGFESGIPGGYQKTATEMSWIASLQALAGNQNLNTTGAHDYRDDFAAKSLMTPEGALITEDALISFFSYIASTTTNSNWFIEVNLYGGANSVINQRSLTESSFGRRNALLNFQLYASSPTWGPPYYENGFTFLEGTYDAIVNPMSGAWGDSYGAYVNYVDPTLTTAEWQSLYWGTQYPRLASLRGKYDPLATFNYPQAIIANSTATS